MTDSLATDVSANVEDPAASTGIVPSAYAMPSLPIEALQDVEMKVEVVFGRARLRLHELLDVRPGQVIELDRARNSPVEVLVNGTLFARGEVVVIDDSHVGVRISHVVTSDNLREAR